jgi:H2-forming N5,N10-methylenetetrahydromethanopterin dehydrogenase-like enzyme
MSETLYTCDCCVRNGNDEASCYRAVDLCVIGDDVVCEGCCDEYPYDAFITVFTPSHEKRIAELEKVAEAALLVLWCTMPPTQYYEQLEEPLRAAGSSWGAE